jgi:hypothetical protein
MRDLHARVAAGRGLQPDVHSYISVLLAHQKVLNMGVIRQIVGKMEEGGVWRHHPIDHAAATAGLASNGVTRT